MSRKAKAVLGEARQCEQGEGTARNRVESNSKGMAGTSTELTWNGAEQKMAANAWIRAEKQRIARDLKSNVMHRTENKNQEDTMKELRVRITFFEELLGTASNDKDIHKEFIASKAPDAPSREEEVAAVGVNEVVEKSMTVFPRDKDGNPIMWDYQVKGFFKDTCGMLRKVTGSKSSKIKAYKKEIDELIFVNERQIPIKFDGEIGSCQRPLRGQTAQGERISLANSETIPSGATIEFTVKCLIDSYVDVVREWFDYGELRGMGQWRNSGKGRFFWDELDSEENVIGENNQKNK